MMPPRRRYSKGTPGAASPESPPRGTEMLSLPSRGRCALPAVSGRAAEGDRPVSLPPCRTAVRNPGPADPPWSLLSPPGARTDPTAGATARHPRPRVRTGAAAHPPHSTGAPRTRALPRTGTAWPPKGGRNLLARGFGAPVASARAVGRLRPPQRTPSTPGAPLSPSGRRRRSSAARTRPSPRDGTGTATIQRTGHNCISISRLFAYRKHL